MAYGLGIDAGTTFTAAAIFEAGGRPEMVALGANAFTVPSVLFLGDDHEWVVGEAAAALAVASPDRVARHFKRRMGDPTPMLVGGSPCPPEELLGVLVSWVVDQVATVKGLPPELVVLTHPANWGSYRRDLFETAVQEIGVPVQFIAEPAAAAVHYSEREHIEDGDLIAVYDLGGGTFDAVVMQKSAQSFEFVGRPVGIEQLGGVDFDESIMLHVLDAFGDEVDLEDPSVVSDAAKLRRECVDAKQVLSDHTATQIAAKLGSASVSVRLTRSEFETLIRPRIDRTAAALADALEFAGVEPEELSRILMVGASSRIPSVGEALARRFATPLVVDAHPKNCVALGAAVLAHRQLAAPTPPVVERADSRPLMAESSSEGAPERPPPAPLFPDIEEVAPPVVPAPSTRAPTSPHPHRPPPGRRGRARFGITVAAIAALVPIALWAANRLSPADEAEPIESLLAGPSELESPPASTRDEAESADDLRADAAAAVDLAGVCPSPVVFQDDWYPGAEHGAIFELVGDGYEFDVARSAVRGNLVTSGGAETGVQIEIRSGGAAVDFNLVSVQMYEDDSITFGYVDSVASIADFESRPTRAFVTPLDKSPQMIMWDPEVFPGASSIADLPDSTPVRHFGGAPFIPYLLAEGILSESQPDDGFDGSSAAFVAAEGSFAQQGYALADPYTFENELSDWGRPIAYELIHDTGFEAYPSAVSVRSDRWDELTPCMRAITPLIQQAQVDFVNDPGETIELLVTANDSYDSFWTYSEGAARYAVDALLADDLVGGGSNAPLGDFDIERLQSFVTLFEASGGDVPAGMSTQDLVSNEFIDDSISL